ncbi:hypothetical protein CY34DRAFT_804694, partial [Suillus luteus UH-Slu-Lm8-n1]
MCTCSPSDSSSIKETSGVPLLKDVHSMQPRVVVNTCLRPHRLSGAHNKTNAQTSPQAL